MKQDWKKVMKRLKLEHTKATAPGFFEASGGYTMLVNPYTDNTSNGLTKAILDFLKFKGHYANRINTQGQARIKKIPRFDIFSGKSYDVEKITWTKGTTRTGTPDIDAIIYGRSVKIEVKIGRDKMSQEQLKEQVRIESSGGLYFIAHDMPAFMEWYHQMFDTNKEQNLKKL